MTDLVITLIGPDRPGLVESVAEPIAALGGNWLESRMAHLAGKFAGILRVEVPAGQTHAAVEALRKLEERGLKIVVETAPAAAALAELPLMELSLVGTDRPGIVHEISHLLVENGVNIEELVTDRSSAPMSGEALFRARARVRVPTLAAVSQLRARLERLASDLMVEIQLVEPVPKAS